MPLLDAAAQNSTDGQETWVKPSDEIEVVLQSAADGEFGYVVVIALPPLSAPTHNESAGQASPSSWSPLESAETAALQELESDGAFELTMLPPVSAAKQKNVEGHEMLRRSPTPLTEKAEKEPSDDGDVETAIVPSAPLATHRLVDGHVIPSSAVVTGCPTDAHVEAPSAGSCEA
ncbi:MAG TPA: hypothetical protein VFB25_13080 [Gaiellaceae bacterium]|nr:hypothetical protein [Gaiellaceae bacterium]